MRLPPPGNSNSATANVEEPSVANKVDRQIIQDGPRNVVVKFTGVLTDDDITLAPALDLSDVSGFGTEKLVGFAGGLVEYSVTSGLAVSLLWTAAEPQQMFVLADANSIGCPQEVGYFYPNQAAPGYDGSLVVSTQGFAPGGLATFTIIARLKKIYAK